MKTLKQLGIVLSVLALSTPIFASKVTLAAQNTELLLNQSFGIFTVCPGGTSRNPWGGIAPGTSRNALDSLVICPGGTSRNPWGGIAAHDSAS